MRICGVKVCISNVCTGLSVFMAERASERKKEKNEWPESGKQELVENDGFIGCRMPKTRAVTISYEMRKFSRSFSVWHTQLSLQFLFEYFWLYGARVFSYRTFFRK